MRILKKNTGDQVATKGIFLKLYNFFYKMTRIETHKAPLL